MKFFALVVVLGFIAAASAMPRTQRKMPGGGKIVGGEDAEEGQFPYILSLHYFGSHICGASIIGESLAVTAAHCVEGDAPSAIAVVAGKHHRTQTGPNEQRRQVTRIVVHEDYDSWSFANDIALLFLSESEPFLYNDYVQAAKLPTQEQQSSGDLVVAGWGTTRQGGSLATILQHVTVPFVTDAECQSAYPQEDVIESMICAGLPEGGKDSCQGDSGGPISSVSDGYLAGIVSWGYGCAQAGYPGVYTETSYFIDWIARQRGAHYFKASVN